MSRSTESTPALDGPEESEAGDDAAPSDAVDDAAPHQPTDSAGEGAGLDGEQPPMLTTPLRDLTLVEALTDTDPGYLPTLRPATMMGGQLVPGAIARRAAVGATLVPITHPGLAPPEPRYRPSKKLADFVRCRDLTCRFPGCHEPATNCDLDHTIPWPQGPTAASNLKALCRRHHLLKTFWGGENGWREQQLDDGTIIWTAPDGRTHTTTPGSRLLFPELSEPTAPVTVNPPPPPGPTSGLTMPRRRTTRAQDRQHRIDDERARNRELLDNPEKPENDCVEAYFLTLSPRPGGHDDPPPF